MTSTNHRSQLLRNIANTPNDDEPRLAFADEIEAEGDVARAEFIRLQCQLATIQVDSPQCRELKLREEELLDEYSWNWAGELDPDIDEWKFQRGFIELCGIPADPDHDKLEAITSSTPLQYLRITGQSDDLRGVVKSLPKFQQLRGLEYWSLYNIVNDDVAEILQSPHLRNLKTLILSLDRNGSSIDERVVISGLYSPLRANLEELSINSDRTSRGPSFATLLAMANSRHLGNLRSLNLSPLGNPHGRFSHDITALRQLGKSANFQFLKALDLGHSRLAFDEWSEILHWPFVSQLRWLRLCGSDVIHQEFKYDELQSYFPLHDTLDKISDVIDWTTEFIHPLFFNASWRGQVWQDRTDALLLKMKPHLDSGDYGELESQYTNLCGQLNGEEGAKAVADLPFSEYESALEAALAEAIESFEWLKGTALILDLRLSVYWNTEIKVVATVPTIRGPIHERPAFETIYTFWGGRLPEAGKAYDARPLYHGKKPSGTALLLIARTIAGIARLVANINDAPPTFILMENLFFALNKR